MTISNCCGVDVSFHYSDEGTNYMSCRKCFKPCDIKPMKHNVKVGSRFKLGHWEWVVRKVQDDMFFAYEKEAWLTDQVRELRLFPHDADQLDWVKPEVTFTKEQVEALRDRCFGSKEDGCCSYKTDHVYHLLKDFLDSHTEEDKPLE